MPAAQLLERGAVGIRDGRADRRDICTEIPWYRGDTERHEPKAAMTIKSRTLRLPADQAEALEAIAGVDEVSVNEEIQRAIAAHIEARRSDPDFRQRLKASMERNREILERLAR
jgi:hypothetical protein